MNLQINPLPAGMASRPGNEDSGLKGRKYLIGGAALVLVLGGFWYFTHDSAPKAKRNLAAPVKVAAVESRTMAVIERTIGTVIANSNVSVNARVQGQLVKAFFKEGQMVKLGDPLFQIDPRPYEAIVDQAIANRDRDQAQLANTKLDLNRATQLAKLGAGTGQSADTLRAQVAALTASVAADKAQLDIARLNLTWTTIRSPISGTPAYAGTPSDAATPGTTSNGMHARAQASISPAAEASSPGSPETARTTRLPVRADAMTSCEAAVERSADGSNSPPSADGSAVPTSALACVRTTSSTWLSPTSTSARPSASTARRVSSPGSPGPAPRKVT